MFQSPELNLPVQEDSINFDPYGSKDLLAKYCGYKNWLPYLKNNYNWLHGWAPDYWHVHPVLITGFKINSQNWSFVAKKTDETFLKKHHYNKVKAIGLNVVYLPETKVNRIENSLLVMPVHSVDFTEHKHWKFKDYVNEILAIKHLFSKVTICVHPSCYKKGYWVNEFKSAGFDVIVGIDGTKTNALQRLQVLLQSFEYCTTNGFGSALAYSAYFGAKPSIYGTFAEYKKEDFLLEPLFKDFPDVLDFTIEAHSENKIRESFPQLFCLPMEAKECIEWGRYQVGHYSKVSPQEIKKMLGWNLKNKIRFYISFQGLKYSLSNIIPSNIKQIIKQWI